MHLLEIAGRRYVQFPRLRLERGLVHAFSTRPQDVAVRADAEEPARAHRREQMALDLALSPPELRYCAQVHGNRIALVDSSTPPGRLEGCDAVITATPNIPLMTFSADCPLIVLYDPGRPGLGLVHASWRCTVRRLSLLAVQMMAQELGCRPSELRAAIGPGAGPCCYQVGKEVFEAACDLPGRDACFQMRDGRLFFDLWEANRRLLLAAGLLPQHLEALYVCTLCRNDLFYSYRREGVGCGHFGLMAALRET
jgi:YfiH family protein